MTEVFNLEAMEEIMAKEPATKEATGMCPHLPWARCNAARCTLTANCDAKWGLDSRLVALKKKRGSTTSGGLSHDNATMPSYDAT